MQKAIMAHEHKYKYNYIQDKLHTEQYHLYKIHVTEYFATHLYTGSGALFPSYNLTKIYLCNETLKHLGDSCMQNVHLGRYIIGYMVVNFVLRRHVSGLYTSPNEHFEYGYPHSNTLFNIYS